MRSKCHVRTNRAGFKLFLFLFLFVIFLFFFFFKQKTAYEIYQCDWSSDVCSSDLKSVVTKPVVTTKTNVSGNVLLPKIVLFEPGNTTYTTSLPPVRFRVYGPYLNSVLLSIDGNKNISIPHNSYIADVDASRNFKMLNESFETKGALENWSSPNPGFTATIDSSESYYGKHSLKVTTTRISKGWSGISREMSVIPGIRYKIITHIKAENEKGLHIAIDAFDGSKWFRLTNVPGGTDGTFNWKEFSGVVNIPSNVIKIKIILNAGWSLDEKNPAISWFDGIEIFPLTHIQNMNNKETFLLQNLSNGMHSLAIFANNSLSNSTSKLVYFTVNATSQKKKIYTIGDTIKAGNLEVTLKKFYGMKQVSITSNLKKNYAGVDIEVKNTGKNEFKLKFTPYNPVLVDNLGDTYTYTSVIINNGRWVPQPDQLKLDVIYPGAIRKGTIFFTPPVNINVKSLTLALYLNGGKYVFEFKRW